MLMLLSHLRISLPARSSHCSHIVHRAHPTERVTHDTNTNTMGYHPAGSHLHLPMRRLLALQSLLALLLLRLLKLLLLLRIEVP